MLGCQIRCSAARIWEQLCNESSSLNGSGASTQNRFDSSRLPLFATRMSKLSSPQLPTVHNETLGDCDGLLYATRDEQYLASDSASKSSRQSLQKLKNARFGKEEFGSQGKRREVFRILAYRRLNEYVWIEPERPGEFDVAIGGRVRSMLGAKRVRVIDDEQREQDVDVSRCRVMHVGAIKHIDDMIKLSDLSEPSLLRNLLVRYKECLIYTYTGSILIAINPYKLLPLYTPEIMKAYNDRKLGEQPPHIYAIADSAYSNMKRFRKNQCVIISGESGAGKTESTKLILQYLAGVSGQHSWIEQQIIESNPIMEAFGNAKTVRNDNSSRFGKYIEIQFTPSGAIESSRIDQYLLEKSRLISQMHDERNYHIFYCLCAGLSQEDKRQLKLLEAYQYAYLISGGNVKVEGRDDAQEFASIRSAMKVLMFTDEEIWQIYRLLTALLYIGNVRHTAKVVDTMDTIEIKDSRELTIVAEFLEVGVNALNDAFTTRTLVTRGESVTSLLSAEGYTDVKDAFVKGVYGRLFVWIIDKINTVIFKPEQKKTSRASIGLLDIFGFENFEKNSFEQLCINYANENLQQFFVQHVFKLEQEEYDLEQINWQRIQFVDNQESLDMIAVRPMNILALIDEESKFPQGTDLSLLTKLHSAHAANRNYLKPRSDVKVLFGINHYAGVVFYDANGFLEKNRDSFSNDLLTLVRASKNAFVKSLFRNDLEMGAETRKRLPTLSAQFKKSLEVLMQTLSNCQPFFVRCVKPNDFKLPLSFDRPLCVRQLRYSGMMETIRIRRSGYPIRHNFLDFVTRYRALSAKVSRVAVSKLPDYRAAAQMILQQALGNSDFQLGRTKVFLKDEQDLRLEQARDRALRHYATVIQKSFRGYQARRKYKQMKVAIRIIQRAWRGHADRARYLRLKRGLLRLQALLRTRVINRNFSTTRSMVIQLQRASRGYVARRNAKARKHGAVVIQCWIRRHLARKLLLKLRAERAIIIEAERLREQKEHEYSRHHSAKLAKEKADEWLENYLKSKELEIKAAEARQRTERARQVRAIIDQSLRKETVLSEGAILAKIANRDEDAVSLASQQELAKSDFAKNYHLPMPAGQDDRELFEYTFTKFAATYFQDSGLCTFSRRLLKHPLLHLANESDQLAALAVYVTILRFMGDVPDPVATERDKTPIMTRIYGTIGKKVSHGDLEQLRKLTDEYEKNPTSSVMMGTYKRKRHKLVSNTLKKASKITGLFADAARQNQAPNVEAAAAADSGVSIDDKLINEMFIANRPMSKLEKIHFVIGNGILRPDLRDEIYSQLCKQLSQNPGSNSRTYGWILMSLCLGCFAPSDRMSKYLQRFVMDAPGGFAVHCENQLKRTRMNGTRSQPPAYIELQATRSKKPILLSVTLTNSSTLSLVADSATTARELCQQIAAQLGLQEQFGFSLFIALLDKVSSLGNGNDHLMDAISQCEQFAKEHGYQERVAPWKLYYRKEIFAPWPCISEDGIAIKLAYCQIVRGLKLGDYRGETEHDLAYLVALQYFVDHAAEISIDRLRTLLPNYLPEQLAARLDASQTQFWIKLIVQAFQQAQFMREKATQLRVMKDVVNYAKFKWPLLFSRFYEAKRLSLHENRAATDVLARVSSGASASAASPTDLIIAVNWTGVYLVDDREQVLLEISYPEIAGISCVSLPLNEQSALPGPRFNVIKLLTIRNESFAFAAPNAEDIKDLVVYFLEGLKKRSRYVITLQDFTPPSSDAQRRMATRKGDLLVLDVDSATYSLMEGAASPYRTGKNVTTGQFGEFAIENVYVLPCISPPPREIVAHFTHLNYKNIADFYKVNSSPNGESDIQSQNRAISNLRETDAVDSAQNRSDANDANGRRHTLERYALQYFRAPQRSGTISKAAGAGSSSQEALWRHSKESLTRPLLLKLQSREDLMDAALKCYSGIRAYMGDHQQGVVIGAGAKKSGDPSLISPIFDAILSNELLKDEAYCQLVKQITANPSRSSEERGWELLWLATGSCAPSSLLLQEVIRFLKSVKAPIAADCLNRLYKTMKNGQRKFGPHSVEISAIQERTTQILHKVYFPDDTDEAFEVESSTRARDLVRMISEQLKLKTAACFSLFVKAADRVFSVPEADFFFDYITQLTDWSKRAGLLVRDDQPLVYQLFFMKKLWTNTVPGEDLIADTRFHYYQELPKLLRGYHRCTVEESAQLAALVYRVTYDKDSSALQHLNEKMLRELLPADLIGKKTVADWSRTVAEQYARHASLRSEDAKVEFLKILYRWPTFGSAFFEVKQTSLADLPMQVLIMINKNGVSVIEPNTKNLLVTYSFRSISNWASGTNWFYMIVGPLVQGTKLVCETPLGYKMDDLLTSYVQLLVSTPDLPIAAEAPKTVAHTASSVSVPRVKQSIVEVESSRL